MRDVIALRGGNWLSQSRWVDSLQLARTTRAATGSEWSEKQARTQSQKIPLERVDVEKTE